jgi:GNAT superfamily N-acetyltransferase
MIPLGLELRTSAAAWPFVIETWLRTYRRIFRVRGLDRARWYEGQRDVALGLVHLVRVAVRPSAPHTVHAWVCGEPGTLHYVYVAHALRRHGVGRALIETIVGAEGRVSHCLPHESRSAFRGLVHDPFALFDALRKAA